MLGETNINVLRLGEKNHPTLPLFTAHTQKLIFVVPFAEPGRRRIAVSSTLPMNDQSPAPAEESSVQKVSNGRRGGRIGGDVVGHERPIGSLCLSAQRNDSDQKPKNAEDDLELSKNTVIRFFSAMSAITNSALKPFVPIPSKTCPPHRKYFAKRKQNGPSIEKSEQLH